MSDRLVSIVIGNHNYGHFLRDAIESGLAQTWPHAEVVVVDDGSTDDSRSIVAEYGSRIIPVFKENGGQGSALNAGLAASRGDIVIYLDSDDILRPEAAENALRAFKPGVVRVQYPLTVMDANGRSLGVNTPIVAMSSDRILQHMLRGIMVERAPTSGNAFTREFLEQVLPMPEAEWRRSADAYLCTLATFRGDLVTLPQPLGFYRIHSNNLVAGDNFDLKRIRATLCDIERVAKLVKSFARENGLKLRKKWMLWEPGYISGRLASLKLGPEQHPYPGETTLGLALQGVRASVEHPLFTLRKRLFYAAWFTMAPMLPALAVELLMKMKLKITFEGRFSRVLGTGSIATAA